MGGRFIGIPVGLLALSMMAPLFCALLLGEGRAALGFGFAVLFTAFFAVALLLTLQTRRSSLQTRNRASLFPQLLALWFLLPVFAAIPFALGGVLDATDAYFESVSAFTTTGASLLETDAPRSMLFWRALLQWLGGLASLMMLAAFLHPMRLVEMGEGAAFLPRKGGFSSVEDMSEIAVVLLLPYALVSVLCLLGLLFSGMPAFESLCLALSLISTAGFVLAPETGVSVPASLVMLVFMLAGAINFSFFCACLRGNFRVTRGLPEIWLLLFIWLAAGLLLALFLLWARGAGGMESLGNGLFAAAALLSGTAQPVGGDVAVPLPLALLLVIVGGCCFATTGGLRVARVRLMARHSWRELERLIHPRGVVSIERNVSDAGMQAIWAYFGAFLLLLAGGCILLSLTGMGLPAALSAAAAAFANAGLLPHYLDGASGFSYDGMGVARQGILIVLMVAGRVEILLLPALFLPAQWRG